jgi:hypothetical protein
MAGTGSHGGDALMVLMSFYDDGTAAQEEANDLACIDARRVAGVSNPENIDIDCEEECPIRLTSCPFGVPERVT